MLTSVRFALGLIGFLAAAGLLGTLLPQVPLTVRGSPDALAAWLVVQETRFGALTEPLHRLGLFDVFHAPWFMAGLAVLVVSVAVCTLNRWAPVWRTVLRPPQRVPDAFFERARHRTTLTTALDAPAVVRALRRRRFRVVAAETPTATYLFADRYAWAGFGTFVSHLSLILLLAGGLVSRFGTVEQHVVIGAGATAGVFSPTDPRHLQVHVDQAIGRFGADGRPVEFRSTLTLSQNGRVVKHGQTTVNDPLRYGGFRFHQSSFSADGAALRVVDRRTGNTVYSETLLLSGAAPAPVIDVRAGDGSTLYHGVYLPTDDAAVVRERAQLSVGLVAMEMRTAATGAARSQAEAQPAAMIRRDGRPASGAWTLVVSDLEGRSGPARRLRPGDIAQVRDLTVAFVGVAPVPALAVPALPGFPDGALLRMPPAGPNGRTLIVEGAGRAPVALRAGAASNVAGDLEYTFDGERGVTGITVRRDPGTGLVWLAVALMIVGLGITFYVPRRRLWARLADGRLAVAGQAGMSDNLAAEMDRLVSEAEAEKRSARRGPRR